VVVYPRLRGVPGQSTANTIAVIAPTTSKLNGKSGGSTMDISELTLFTGALPTLVETASSGYTYNVRYGYDEGDPVFDNSAQLAAVKSKVGQMVGAKSSHIHVSFEKFPAGIGILSIWNNLAKQAHEAGAEYIFALNDDTRLLTRGW